MASTVELDKIRKHDSHDAQFALPIDSRTKVFRCRGSAFSDIRIGPRHLLWMVAGVLGDADSGTTRAAEDVTFKKRGAAMRTPKPAKVIPGRIFINPSIVGYRARRLAMR